jgi:hypothetical protein
MNALAWAKAANKKAEASLAAAAAGGDSMSYIEKAARKVGAWPQTPPLPCCERTSRSRTDVGSREM